MPFLTTKDPNTGAAVDFFYQDSGSPDRTVYTTLVVIHGLFFHGAVFKHILPIAASKGFRVVCLNRRGYPGTTPYTPAEFKALSQGGINGFKTLGAELSLFLDGIIETLSLPAFNVDEDEGGLGVMGWSIGNLFTMSILASITTLSSKVKARLQSYLRRSILFDPPTIVFGIPSAYSPLLDHKIPEGKRPLEFARWVSSYFTHGDLSTHKLDNIEFKFPDSKRFSIAASLSSEELDSLVDYNTGFHSDLFLLEAFEPLLFDHTGKILFDPETRSLWPNLTIWFLDCDSSAGVMVHAALEIKQHAEANGDQAIKFLTIENAHHLVFWDEPKRAMDTFDHCLRH